MRNAWKVALAFTLALGLGGALAQAQPTIVGNTAAFGCGPIATSDFTLGVVTHRFYPDGAGGANCPDNPINHHNGRGLAFGSALGVLEVYYTELDEVHPGVPAPGFGGSQGVHVALFNNGDGSADTRLLTNPRSGSGIQDLTFAGSTLYVLTGYDYQVPIVYGLNPFTGALTKAGVTIARPGFTDDSLDGFAVLPNGNFLMNNMGTSCIYSEYSSATGAFIGNTINVPGGPARCTGVDTDGTSLYFLTDFTAITRTDFAGNMTAFNYFDGPGGEDFTEDISLVHPLTTITTLGDGHFWFSRISSDDNSVRFDLRAEVLKNATVIATGITRCTLLPNQGSPLDFIIPLSLPAGVVLQSGDVISARLSTRAGTTVSDVLCGGPTRAVGIRFYYDSIANSSRFPMTIAPSASDIFYFHSDGTNCQSGGSTIESGGVTSRTLSDVVPNTANTKCKHSDALTGAVGNPWVYFNVPTNTVGSVPALWKLAAQP